MGGVRFAAVQPTQDGARLAAMRGFLTGTLEGITPNVAVRLDTRPGIILIGNRAPLEADRSLQAIPGKTAASMRNALARAHSTAGYDHMQQSENRGRAHRQRVSEGRLR